MRIRLLLIAMFLAPACVALLGCEDQADSPPTDAVIGQYERDIVPPYSDAEADAKANLQTYAMDKKRGSAPVTVPPSGAPATGTPPAGPTPPATTPPDTGGMTPAPPG